MVSPLNVTVELVTVTPEQVALSSLAVPIGFDPTSKRSRGAIAAAVVDLMRQGHRAVETFEQQEDALMGPVMAQLTLELRGWAARRPDSVEPDVFRRAVRSSSLPLAGGNALAFAVMKP